MPSDARLERLGKAPGRPQGSPEERTEGPDDPGGRRAPGGRAGRLRRARDVDAAGVHGAESQGHLHGAPPREPGHHRLDEPEQHRHGALDVRHARGRRARGPHGGGARLRHRADGRRRPELRAPRAHGRRLRALRALRGQHVPPLVRRDGEERPSSGTGTSRSSSFRTTSSTPGGTREGSASTRSSGTRPRSRSRWTSTAGSGSCTAPRTAAA